MNENDSNQMFNQIELLETELKQLKEANEKITNLKNLSLEKYNKLSDTLESYKLQVIKLNKQIHLHKNKLEEKRKLEENKSNINELVLDSQSNSSIRKIYDYFAKIRNDFNQPLSNKLKKNIELMAKLEKETRIKFAIVKKIEISSEFLKNFKIEDKSDFENLFELSNIDKLNYNVLKHSGPLLTFRIERKTTFENLYKKSITFWNLEYESYCLYDENFNNLDCVKGVQINDYVSNYFKTDPSLKKGEFVIYVVKKIKKQTELLDPQIKSLENKASSIADESNDKRTAGEIQLEDACNMTIEGKIFKGIDLFQTKKRDEDIYFKSIVNMPDNNIIFVICSLLFLIFSIISFATKRNIKAMTAISESNKKLFNEIGEFKNNDIYESILTFLDLINYSNHNNQFESPTDYVVVTNPQMRFVSIINNLDAY